MNTFTLKCPGCGVWLEADENDVGATAECVQCGKRFILTKDAEKRKHPERDRLLFLSRSLRTNWNIPDRSL